MNNLDAALYSLLRANPKIHAAIPRNLTSRPSLELHAETQVAIERAILPSQLHPFVIIPFTAPKIKALLLRGIPPQAENEHQACQNEPISLGTQIQPATKNWVGTAGAPLQWKGPDNAIHTGILSNWHVMSGERTLVARLQHQPDAAYPVMAQLAMHHPPSTTAPNYIDAAFAHAKLNGFHTIDRTILGIGPIKCAPRPATIGLRCCKAGRTTEVTYADCESVGAAVRVSYDTFDALFVDQDVFESDMQQFSAPGDSGSLILSCADKCPVSLLFAGNDEMTIGNPIRHLPTEYQLNWMF